MLSRRIRAADRAPSAKLLAIASLKHWRLRFNKVGKDSSGKGNIEHTGNDDDCVWGVVYEISPSDRHAMDRAEGLGIGYRDAEVVVTTPSGDTPALTYIANQTDDELLPFCWYHALLCGGAVEHAWAES